MLCRSISETNLRASSVGNSFLVTVKSRDMGSKLMLLKSMANQPCVVTLDNSFNACTGLVYTYDIHYEDITGFQEGVKREFGLIKVQLASWKGQQSLSS